MKIDYKLIGHRIKKSRSDLNITQDRLSELLDVSNVYVSKIERGKTKLNLEMIFNISNILNVPVNSLITGIDQDCVNYLDQEIVDFFQICNPEKKKMIHDIIKIIAES